MTIAAHRPGLVMMAFATLYLVWGSTYLAVKYAVESFPPFLMSAVRFVIAGSLLYVVGLFRKWPRPTGRQWRYALLMGTLFMGSMGSVAWSEQYVDSSLAALIITSEPILVVLTLWLFKKRSPGRQRLVGLTLGIIGMLVLVGPSSLAVGESRAGAVIVIFLSSIAWAMGSVYPAHSRLPQIPTQSIALQMLCGGGVLLILSLLVEDWGAFRWAKVEPIAWVSWVYLIVFGSIIAFSAFTYLLRVVSPDKVATMLT